MDVWQTWGELVKNWTVEFKKRPAYIRSLVRKGIPTHFRTIAWQLLAGADVEAMQANGLALGGVPGENAVVFDGDHIESGAGLRHADEPVRHKMLDALGDLALAGGPILGRYVGERAGHALTNTLLRALFAEPGAVREVTCTAAIAARLPGQGLAWSEIPAESRRVA